MRTTCREAMRDLLKEQSFHSLQWLPFSIIPVSSTHPSKFRLSFLLRGNFPRLFLSVQIRYPTFVLHGSIIYFTILFTHLSPLTVHSRRAKTKYSFSYNLSISIFFGIQLNNCYQSILTPCLYIPV